ncbi:hypothetical protein JVU11DRAFT_9691 [Chiua virens]|nr:hypothetical protein JVU11DRAFT_9691 [Chiua virens]
MIINAFEDLRNDERIKNGDPLVIFYAGHGGELPAPTFWGSWGLTERTIQCLLPRDYERSVVHPIPDRTIGALIEDIAKTRGDNITVIFDCCHSASGTRVDNEAYTPRTVDLGSDPMIPVELDHDIWTGRAGKISSGFAYHGLRSHVLLAACGEGELAYEYKGRGQFTAALLEILKNCALDDVTYVDVLEGIHLNRQNPHCEGLNQHRVIFDTRVPAGRQVRHSVRMDNGGKYVFGAGLAHGVSHGVEFTLYNEQKRMLSVATVDETAVIEDFQTTLSTPLDFTDVSFAKLTRVGNLLLYLNKSGDSQVLEESFWKIDVSASKFRLVKEVKQAKLEVGMENSELVILKVLDPQLKRFGMKTVFFRTTLDCLPHALNAAAHYYWYLDLIKENDHIDTKDGVVVEFYLLQESDREYDEFGLPLLVPVEPGLCRKDPDAEISTVIDFVVDPSALYGVKVTNHTKRDLYLNAFLFNNSSLSIVPCYTQPGHTKTPEAPLKKNGAITIGYGPGGTSPFTYSLEEGRDIDVGYLKFFFATRAVDLSDVAQSPPFSMYVHEPVQIDDDARKARLKASSSTQSSSPSDTWFTLVIPVVQKSKAAV